MTGTSHNSGRNQARPTAQGPKLGYGDYLRFRALVLERSGLHFPEKKRADLEIGLLKALAESPLVSANGQYNLDQYYQLLCDRYNPAGRTEMDRLIKTLTIGETYFFRDEAQFNALISHVLPAIITKKRTAAAAVGVGIQPQLRIWSAGCASGEEPYSIAILLKEILPDLDNWRILILATDINQDSLARAGQAVYSDWSFRETRAKALRPSYFTQVSTDSALTGHGQSPPLTKNRYRLDDDIRRMVTFASLNLTEDNYPSPHNNTVSMDLILCRNVTIYFTEEITRQVIQRFYRSLVAGGWLIVGHSEPSLATYQAFETQTFPDALLYYKPGDSSGSPGQSHGWFDGMPTPGSKKEPNIARREAQPSTPGQISTQSNSPIASAARPSGDTVFPQKFKVKPLRPTGADPYELARSLLNRGQINQAIEKLQDKLAVDPEFAPAHTLLGRAYANLEQWTEARGWCQSALELDSLQAEAYYILALIYQHEAQPELAIAMFKKAIYLDRQAPLVHFNLAMLYQKTGQMQKARLACQNVIKILEKWPLTRVVPDSGGVTANRLLTTARHVLDQLT